MVLISKQESKIIAKRVCQNEQFRQFIDSLGKFNDVKLGTFKNFHLIIFNSEISIQKVFNLENCEIKNWFVDHYFANYFNLDEI